MDDNHAIFLFLNIFNFKESYKTIKKVYKQINSVSVMEFGLSCSEEILIKLSYFKKFVGDLADFERKLELQPGNPTSRKLFKLLLDEGILIKKERYKVWDNYELNVKKLCRFIENQSFFKRIKEYIEYSH